MPKKISITHKRTKMFTPKITISLPVVTKKTLDSLAEAQGISTGALMRQIVKASQGALTRKNPPNATAPSLG